MKYRNLIIWAGLTCACLTAFLSCAPITKVAQFIGIGQEKVKLSPQELQRLVYSSHVLTVIDEKPELEGALLALRELHQENPQASPTSLVRPVRWALAEYRKEDSNRTLPVVWRDEVLGRYFLKFSEDPEEDPKLPERRDVVLKLLNVLLTQQDASDLLGDQAGLFNAESQRLLAVANGPGERQALVKSCMQRARSDPNFAAAMDELLRPALEIGIGLNTRPRDILSANPALKESPTMRELMRLSSSSKDGSVVITMDKLKGLFVAEVAVAQEAVTTHQALDREIDRAHEDLVKYPDNATRVAEMIQRHADEQARQRGRIAASSAAAKELSGMALELAASQDAKTLDTISNTLGLAGSSLSQFATNPVGGILSLVGAGCQFSTLFMDQGPPPEETILESVQLVGQMITDLSEEMEGRFDRVDRSLVYILQDLRSAVLLVGQVGHDVDQVRGDLLEAQASLNRLERELGSYLNAGFGRELVKHINGDLGFEARTGESMSWKWYRATDGPENAFHTWAVHNAKDNLASPQPADADLADIHLLVQLESRPLERNLNYIKEFLDHRLGVLSLPEGPIAGLGDWYAGANAYLRLAAENPQHFRHMPGSLKRLDEVIQAGTELEDFFRRITFVKSGPDAQVNRKLYDAVLSYYEEKLNAFNAAVSGAEVALAPDFDAQMWRQWEARAPRLAVTETAVRKPTAGRRSALALRDDGHTVAVARDSGILVLADKSTPRIVGITDTGCLLTEDGRVTAPNAALVPSDLGTVVAVDMTDNHSLALKADGSLVEWRGRLQLALPDDLPHAIAIAAGPRHSLALGDNGSVMAWGREEHNAKIGGVAIATGWLDVRIEGTDREEGAIVRWSPGENLKSASVEKYDCGLNEKIANSRYNPKNTTWYKNGIWSQSAASLTVFPHEGERIVVDEKRLKYEHFKVPDNLNDAVAIAAGNRHSLALRANGTVVAWGDQRLFRYNSIQDLYRRTKICPHDKPSLPTQPTVSQLLQSAFSDDLPMNLRQSLREMQMPQRLWQEPQWIVPPDLSEVVAIAAGGDHSLALSANGEVVAWGDNNYGQCEVPDEAKSNVVAITAGEYRSLALKENGKVVAWGRNDQGQCDFAASQTGVLAMAASCPTGGRRWGIMAATDYDIFLVSQEAPIIDNTEPLRFMRGEPPRAVMLRLHELCEKLLSEFDLDLNDSLNQLTGAKALLESVLALGLPETLDQDEVLRGFLSGSESLIDRDGARQLYEAERYRLDKEWKLRASTLEETPRKRLEDFRRRLNERLHALEKSGTPPEIPRMVAYTLLQLRLLRAAY